MIISALIYSGVSRVCVGAPRGKASRRCAQRSCPSQSSFGLFKAIATIIGYMHPHHFVDARELTRKQILDIIVPEIKDADLSALNIQGHHDTAEELADLIATQFLVIGLFALRRIGAGEEILVQYGHEYKDAVRPP